MSAPSTAPYLRRIASFMLNAGRGGQTSSTEEAAESPTLFEARSYALCRICTGPIDARYQLCYPCSHTPAQMVPDVAAFLSYAMNGLQSGTVARQYKDGPSGRDGDPQSIQHMQILLYLCMAKHSGCLLRTHAYDRLGVATVPSGSGRAPHPLDEYLFPYVQGPPVVDVRRTAPPRPQGHHEKTVDPSRYEIRSDVTDAHVLVLDDTWTTGTQMFSVVGALREAGAARVTSLCVMRYLQRGYHVTAGWLQEQGKFPKYSDDFCPVTRSFTCPT